MGLRSPHGNARKKGLPGPRIETPPWDELPSAKPTATGSDTVRGQRDEAGRFKPGNTVAKSKRHRVGKRGLLSLADADPNAAAFVRWGRSYASHRLGELAAAFGAASAGVGGLIESAGQALASSRFLQWQGTQTGDVSLLAKATDLATKAGQLERGAWELAAKEAEARNANTNPTHTALANILEKARTHDK